MNDRRVESIFENLRELHNEALHKGDIHLMNKLDYAAKFIFYSMAETSIETNEAQIQPMEFDLLYQDYEMAIFGTPDGKIMPIKLNVPLQVSGKSRHIVFPDNDFRQYTIDLCQYQFRVDGRTVTISIGFNRLLKKWILAKGEL